MPGLPRHPLGGGRAATHRLAVVSGIVVHVVAARAGQIDRLAGGCVRSAWMRSPHHLGQRYLLVVTDRDTGRLVWVGKNRTAETLRQFFDDLGAERAAALIHVSADGAEFIHTVVAERAPACGGCA